MNRGLSLFSSGKDAALHLIAPNGINMSSDFNLETRETPNAEKEKIPDSNCSSQRISRS